MTGGDLDRPETVAPARAAGPVTVATVWDQMAAVGPAISPTVDTLALGSRDTVVTGIAVTFMATVHVLERAVEERLNLVIAHEGPFFRHRDDDGAEGMDDPIVREKRALMDRHGLSLLRWHDHLHRVEPDAVVEGLLDRLGFRAQLEPHQVPLPLKTPVAVLPPQPLRHLVGHVKRALAVPFVRVVGDLDRPVSRVGLLPGYNGTGRVAVPYLRDARLDLLITGEGPEWETAEWVRDAIALGHPCALLLLGHAASEAAGMERLGGWLRRRFPGLPVRWVEDRAPFHWL